MRTAVPKFAATQVHCGWLLLLAAGVLAAGGCADGFVPEARSINPYVRKQGEEDEKRGPTYYKRMDELQQVRAQASQLPAPEKQRLAKEIVDVLAIENQGYARVYQWNLTGHPQVLIPLGADKNGRPKSLSELSKKVGDE